MWSLLRARPSRSGGGDRLRGTPQRVRRGPQRGEGLGPRDFDGCERRAPEGTPWITHPKRSRRKSDEDRRHRRKRTDRVEARRQAARGRPRRGGGIARHRAWTSSPARAWPKRWRAPTSWSTWRTRLLGRRGRDGVLRDLGAQPPRRRDRRRRAAITWRCRSSAPNGCRAAATSARSSAQEKLIKAVGHPLHHRARDAVLRVHRRHRRVEHRRAGRFALPPAYSSPIAADDVAAALADVAARAGQRHRRAGRPRTDPAGRARPAIPRARPTIRGTSSPMSTRPTTAWRSRMSAPSSPGDSSAHRRDPLRGLAQPFRAGDPRSHQPEGASS